MKTNKMLKSWVAICMAVLMVLGCLPLKNTSVKAAGILADVYVSETGSDTAAGTKNAPVATLAKAIELAKNNGIIHVTSDLELKETIVANKDSLVTIQGDKIDGTPAVIKRAFSTETENDHMFWITSEQLQFNNITLDGNKETYKSVKGSAIALEYTANSNIKPIAAGLGENTKIINAASSEEGGAILVKGDGSQFTMRDNASIMNCEAKDGGAIAIKGGMVVLKGAMISKNRATGTNRTAGAITVIEPTNIENDVANSLVISEAVTITDNITASENGAGAIYNGYTMASAKDKIMLKDNILIEKNQVTVAGKATNVHANAGISGTYEGSIFTVTGSLKNKVEATRSNGTTSGSIIAVATESGYSNMELIVNPENPKMTAVYQEGSKDIVWNSKLREEIPISVKSSDLVRTSNTIIVKDADTRQEYSIFDKDGTQVGETLSGAKTEVSFLNLKENTVYTVRNRKLAGVDTIASEYAEGVTVTTKSIPDVPAEVKASDITTTITTLTVENTVDGAEYKLKDARGNEIKGYTSPSFGKVVFSDLKEGTTYIVIARMAETDTKDISEETKGTKAVTKITPFAPEAVPLADVRVTSNGIYITNASSEQEYQLLDSKGNVIKSWVEPTGGKVIFDGLKENTTYQIQTKVIAMNGNPESPGSVVTKVTTKSTGSSTNETKKITFKKQTVKLKSKKKKQLIIQWIKDVNASGYQIKYGTKKSLKGAKVIKVKSYKTYKKTIKNLKCKKRYYVKVRAYKVVRNSTKYGAYSTRKSLKIK